MSVPVAERFSELVAVAAAVVAAVSNEVDPLAPTMSTTPAAPAWSPVVVIGLELDRRYT